MGAAAVSGAGGCASDQDPGWYDAPSGTQAMMAAGADLQRDGIDVKAAPAVEDDETSRPAPT